MSETLKNEITIKYETLQTDVIEDCNPYLVIENSDNEDGIRFELTEHGDSLIPSNLTHVGKLDLESNEEPVAVKLTQSVLQTVNLPNNPKYVLVNEKRQNKRPVCGDKSDKIKRHSCSHNDCNKTFKSLQHLKTHELIHTGELPHICHECGKCFNSMYTLRYHLLDHTGEKPYPCKMRNCEKKFKTSGDLHKHIRTHTGERPFKCEVCSKSFTTSNIRKVHMRLHTGERPYKCSFEGCNKSFSSVTNYKNHKRIHTGEKPYLCTLKDCGKRFTEYSSLYKHQSVHYKEYICFECNKEFHQYSTFINHKKSHGENIEVEKPKLVLMKPEQYVMSPVLEICKVNNGENNLNTNYVCLETPLIEETIGSDAKQTANNSYVILTGPVELTTVQTYPEALKLEIKESN